MTVAILTLILNYSNYYSMDPLLVSSVIQVESKFNVHARGRAGEVGLMQIMPANAKSLTVGQLERPSTNIELGVKLLAESRKQCVHKSELTWLVCYNVGAERAKLIRFPKNQRYYKRVMSQYKNALKLIYTVEENVIKVDPRAWLDRKLGFVKETAKEEEAAVKV